MIAFQIEIFSQLRTVVSDKKTRRMAHHISLCLSRVLCKEEASSPTILNQVNSSQPYLSPSPFHTHRHSHLFHHLLLFLSFFFRNIPLPYLLISLSTTKHHLIFDSLSHSLHCNHTNSPSSHPSLPQPPIHVSPLHSAH